MLLVSLFKVTRCSYALLVDEEHFTVVQCAVSEGVFSRGMETGVNFELKGTGVGHCIASKGKLLVQGDCNIFGVPCLCCMQALIYFARVLALLQL
jgi:hypothetical protein